jgi:hypothetical protein
METQRTRLIELQAKAGVVADLIQITRELGQVQSELERIARTERDLAQRTDRERVDISFRAPALGPPAADDWSHLGPRLLRILSASSRLAVVSAVYALPWLFLGLPPLLLAGWLGRRWWRRF